MVEKAKPRLLFVTTDYPPGHGGLQAYSQALAWGLARTRLGFALLGRDRSGTPGAVPDGLPHRFFPGPSRLRAGLATWFWIPWLKLRHGLTAQLHMQWTTSLPSWALARLGLPSRYAILVHGMEALDPGRPFLTALKKRLLADADLVAAGSRATADWLRGTGIRISRLEVVPYGNPLEGWLRRPEGRRETAARRQPGGDVTPRLLCVHRLVPRKGSRLLLEALARVRHLPWTLELAGEGPEAGALIALCDRLGLPDRVTFPGALEEGAKIRKLLEADLFLLPSLPPGSPGAANAFEGLGLSLLEAQSVGTPVLAADTGGIPEALDPGRTGWLFRAGDAGDLAEKLASLLREPARLGAAGKLGPEWVAGRFSWARTLAGLERALDGIG